MLAISCGSVSSPNAFNSPTSAATSGIERIHRRQFRNFGAGRFWRGAGRLHRIRRPRFVMRQQRREHDERQRVGVLIAVEHVANERAFGLVHAGGSQGVGGEAGPFRQRDRLPDGFGMQWGVAEIERTDGGPRPFQRARHGREVAPDQVDHAGAENLSNVGIDVGDFTSALRLREPTERFLPSHPLIRS